ncbi:MAG: DUF5958 family protein [Bacteroidota bacterium]
MYEVVLIKYAQGLVSYKPFLDSAFLRIDLSDKQQFLRDIIQLIFSNGIKKNDIRNVFDASELSESLNVAKIFKGGVTSSQMELLTKLPELELEYSFRLLVDLFKVTYQREYRKQKSSPSSWRYWDLSNPMLMLELMNKFNPKDLPKSRRGGAI